MKLAIAALLLMTCAFGQSRWYSYDFAEAQRERAEARRDRLEAERDARQARLEAQREARQSRPGSGAV